MRSAAATERAAGIPHLVDGRFDRDTSGSNAGAHPCDGDSDERARARHGQMVQSAARLRIPDPRGGDSGHFRSYGDVAPLWARRAAPWTDRAGALRTGTEGLDGRRGAARQRTARPRVALTANVIPALHALRIGYSGFLRNCGIAC